MKGVLTSAVTRILGNSLKVKEKMGYILVYAIHWFVNILVTLLLIRAILSWFAGDPYSFLGKMYNVLARFTEPLVMPFRKLLSRFNTGMFDFSVLLAMLFIEMAANILSRLVFMIL